MLRARSHGTTSAGPGAPRLPAVAEPPGSRIFGERQRFMLMLIAPAVLLLILFQAVPIFIGGGASFRDWMLYNPKKTWIGLSHYATVLSDP